MAQPKKAKGVGDRAPRFRLKDQAGQAVQARDLDGRPYVLFFYPKASTSGCTKETCAFRDLSREFQDLGVGVFGVSPDGPDRQSKFHEKYEVPFPLLCDEDHKLAEAYGVWQEKKLYGKTTMGIVRSTFLVDAKGKIVHGWRKVKVAGHADDVLEAASAL